MTRWLLQPVVCSEGLLEQGWSTASEDGAGQSASTSPSSGSPGGLCSVEAKNAFIHGEKGARCSRRACFRGPDATWVPGDNMSFSRGSRPKLIGHLTAKLALCAWVLWKQVSRVVGDPEEKYHQLTRLSPSQ